MEAGGEIGGGLGAGAGEILPGGLAGSGRSSGKLSPALLDQKLKGIATGSNAAGTQEFRAQWEALVRAPAASKGSVKNAEGEVGTDTSFEASLDASPDPKTVAQSAGGKASGAAGSLPLKASVRGLFEVASQTDRAGQARLLRNASPEALEARVSNGPAAQDALPAAAAGATGPLKKSRDEDAAQDTGRVAPNAAQAQDAAAEWIPMPAAAAPVAPQAGAVASSWRIGNPQANNGAIGGGNAASGNWPAASRVGPEVEAALSPALPADRTLAGARPSASMNPGPSSGARIPARVQGEHGGELAGRLDAGVEETEQMPQPEEGLATPASENGLSAAPAVPAELGTGAPSTFPADGRRHSASGSGSDTGRAVARESNPRSTVEPVLSAGARGQSVHQSGQLTGDKPAVSAAMRHEPADGAPAPQAHDKWTPVQVASQQPGVTRWTGEAPGAASTPMMRPLSAGVNASAIITTAPTGSSAKDVFATLDSGTAVGAPTLIHGGSQRAEAGFQDPTLGWVGVRADLTGNVIHAALVPGSPEAAQVLSAHMTGLSAHLAEEHAQVSTLTMAEPGQNGFASGTDAPGSDGGGQQNTSQNDGQSSAAARQTDEQPEQRGILPMNSNTAAPGGPAGLPPLDEWRGSRVSVMA